LLDPVLISADCNVTFSEVIDVCREKSDHNATKISLQIPNYLQKTYQRTIWMYKNADFEKFNKLIRQFNWEESFFTLVNDIDEMADFFTNKYLEMAKECIPTKVVNTTILSLSDSLTTISLVTGFIKGGITVERQLPITFFTSDQNAFGLLEFSSNKPLAFK
jgi:hypothetical protein